MTWWLSLVAFELAFGEAGEDLFDRIFVQLQTAFILLAGVMMLVITQTGTSDYLEGIKRRSDELADFVRADVAYFSERASCSRGAGSARRATAKTSARS